MKNRSNTKTLVDNNNILWTMEYDTIDNSVTVVSDYTTRGAFAIVNQYSIDNDTGQDIPMQIINSAQDMIVQDDDDLITVGLDDIIESYAADRAKQFYA